MLPFGEITGSWSGKTVYIIGGGSSIEGFDFSLLDGVKVGANKAAWLAGCDVMVTIDQHFTRMHREDILRFAESGCEAILGMPPSEDGHEAISGATYVIRRRNQGLSNDPRELWALNSGYAALGVAFLRRASRICLLGFDMRYSRTGKTHFHDGYSWHVKGHHKLMNKWSGDFEIASRQLKADGIEVINYVGEPESLIDVFEKRPLSDLGRCSSVGRAADL